MSRRTTKQIELDLMDELIKAWSVENQEWLKRQRELIASD